MLSNFRHWWWQYFPIDSSCCATNIGVKGIVANLRRKSDEHISLGSRSLLSNVSLPIYREKNTRIFLKVLIYESLWQGEQLLKMTRPGANLGLMIKISLFLSKSRSLPSTINIWTKHHFADCCNNKFTYIGEIAHWLSRWII